MPKERSIFEVYAHEYDLITNAAQREAYHAREVKALVERFDPKRVLDAGCASGLTTALFARHGIETVGLDRSRAMLRVAQKKYSGSSSPLSFTYGRFERLPRRMFNSFDLVVCLANSISGVTKTVELRRAMVGFAAVLRPGGSLVLQMLNYAAVKEHTLMPIKATINNGIVYERFSERQGKSLFVYVTRADFNQSPPAYEIFRHRFDNFSPDQVLRIVKACFPKARTYGDLYLKKPFGARCRDLVVAAEKAR